MAFRLISKLLNIVRKTCSRPSKILLPEQFEMKIHLIIKFGGSGITVKDRLETLKDEELLNACNLVKNCLKQGKKVVVVHGAGSFGHHQAKQYNVNNGFTHLSDEEKSTVKQGLCKTRISVTKLNHVIVERLCDNDIHAVAIPAFGLWSTNNRKIVQHGTDTVIDVLRQGFVPVLHGDCIIDQTKGCVALSGDTIIETLCRFSHVGRVVFLTDVDGIYDKSPENRDAKFIPNIDVNKDGSFSVDISTTDDSKFDVTGGMSHKLNTAKNIVIDSHGKIRVYICDVTSKPADVLKEDSTFKGTIVQFKLNGGCCGVNCFQM